MIERFHRPAGLFAVRQTVLSLLREAALPVFVSTACVTAIGLTAELKTEGTGAYLDPGWDRHLYVAMAAASPLDFHLAPFCWRILVPLLAWLSPFALQPSFFAITLVSAVSSGTLLYFLARAFGAGRPVAAAATLLFYGVGWATRFQVTDFWIPDATATAFSIAAICAANSRVKSSSASSQKRASSSSLRSITR